MLDLIISDDEARVLLINRKAAAILGVAAVLSPGAILIAHWDISHERLGALGGEVLLIVEAVIAVGFFLLFGCMGLFWLKCDVSPKLNRVVWLIVLLFGFAFGSSILYYVLVYLPAVMRRLRNPNAGVKTPDFSDGFRHD